MLYIYSNKTPNIILKKAINDSYFFNMYIKLLLKCKNNQKYHFNFSVNN